METVTATPKSDGDTMIQFYTGASNKDLASKLADHIKATFYGQVFQTVHIITPNKAQHNWLKEQMAEKLGFIGNLKQHSFNSFFRELIESLDPDFKEKPSGEKLIWKLFTEMGKPEFQDKFENIKNYCGEDEIKRLALAQKVAGLFDSYQEFDPAEEWKNQDHPDLEWQKWLYEQCGFSNNQISPKTFKELLLQNPKILQKYHSLYIFGNISLSPLYLQYLKVLKEVEGFSVHLYRTHLDLKRENNPLNQNWGELAVKTKEQLQRLGKIPEMNFPSENGNLLNQIQKDISSDTISDKLVSDDSVLIYNSFTRVREVEALYNYLVKTVDESKGELGARDIMVCIPNIDPYISAIRTVFDSAPYEFPYTLVTKGYGREESFWTALEQVLAFEEENFTAPGVFNLLEMQPIQNAFGFTELDLLKKAFIDANIRREYKGDEKLETNFSSFSNGLERLIYGFCLGNEEPVEINGKQIYPVDIAEGQQAQDLFRLHHLVELLQNFLTLKEEKNSAGAWHEELMNITEEFLQPEDWQQNQFSELMQELGSMEDSSQEEISFNTFFFRLKDKLQNKDQQQIKGRGGIVFSGLYPGMSMPKKVIAFLGLNFGEFPRKSQELSFDLLPDNKKLGSRIKDRSAFLETFLNAENRVLLSYIGQDAKDNSVIPSSAIISELQDYTKEKVREIKHPLHAYNSKYFKEKEEDLFTYLISKKEKIDLVQKEENRKKPEEEINLYQLESFLKDPFRHHYEKALGIYYKDSVNLPDWEVFELSHLDKWKVKDNVLKVKFQNHSFPPEELRGSLLQNALLPLRTFGDKELQETETKVNLLYLKLEEIEKEPNIIEREFSIPIRLNDDRNFFLKAKVQTLGNQGLYLSVSKLKTKYKLLAYVRFLALKAAGISDTLNYVCLNEGEDEAENIIFYSHISQNDALERLENLVQFYVDNFEKIVPFYPDFYKLEIKDLQKCISDEKSKEWEKIRNTVQRKVNEYTSQYLCTEHSAGFFDIKENSEDFKKNFIGIMTEVEDALTTE